MLNQTLLTMRAATVPDLPMATTVARTVKPTFLSKAFLSISLQVRHKEFFRSSKVRDVRTNGLSETLAAAKHRSRGVKWR
jgi:hypothetical protein